MKKLFVLLISVTLLSCTANQSARKYGGSQVIDLETNQRLVNITWKGGDMWILTKTDTTSPKQYMFKEKSNFGILEGTIIINEK